MTSPGGPSGRCSSLTGWQANRVSAATPARSAFAEAPFTAP